VVVTGVGRPAGIGFAIARRLLDAGAKVFCHSFGEGGAAEFGDASERLQFIEADLGDPDAPGG
jgi:3-oxoacyl-[acyl-carrier protein] reductase